MGVSAKYSATFQRHMGIRNFQIRYLWHILSEMYKLVKKILGNSFSLVAEGISSMVDSRVFGHVQISLQR